MDDQLRQRGEILAAIETTTGRAARAVADRDLAELEALGSERERLCQALQAVDRALTLCGGPVGLTPAGRALQQRAEELKRRLLPAEAALQEQLAHWRDETRDELLGLRRGRGARRAYGAAEGGS
jgi:hypothetical protein